MAPLKDRRRLLLLSIFAAAIALLSAGAAEARPGIPFHPCNLFLVSYSLSVQNPNPNRFHDPNRARLFMVDLESRPRGFFLSFPATTVSWVADRRAEPIHRPRALGGRVENGAGAGGESPLLSSFRDRTKDIMSVVVALLFGLGCGFVTAATMYLAWSLLASRFCDLHSSYDGVDGDSDDDDLYSPKKAGYVAIPAPATKPEAAPETAPASATVAAPGKEVV